MNAQVRTFEQGELISAMLLLLLL